MATPAVAGKNSGDRSHSDQVTAVAEHRTGPQLRGTAGRAFSERPGSLPAAPRRVRGRPVGHIHRWSDSPLNCRGKMSVAHFPEAGRMVQIPGSVLLGAAGGNTCFS